MSNSEIEELESVEYDSSGQIIERDVDIEDRRGAEFDDEYGSRDYSEEDYDEVRSIQKKKIKKVPVDSEEELEPMKRNKGAPHGLGKNINQAIAAKKELNLKDYEVNNLLKIVEDYRELNQKVETKHEEIKTQKNAYHLKLLDNNTILKSFEKELDDSLAKLMYERRQSEKLTEELKVIRARSQMDQAELNKLKQELFHSQRELSSLNAKLLELEISKGNLETEIVSIKLENTRVLSQEREMRDQVFFPKIFSKNRLPNWKNKY
jgi:chromosome segregation ATPase